MQGGIDLCMYVCISVYVYQTDTCADGIALCMYVSVCKSYTCPITRIYEYVSVFVYA
jgi:hypothetical protein